MTENTKAAANLIVTLHTFNTGCRYSSDGQPITAVQLEGGEVLFFDHARMVNGELTDASCREGADPGPAKCFALLSTAGLEAAVTARYARGEKYGQIRCIDYSVRNAVEERAYSAYLATLPKVTFILCRIDGEVFAARTGGDVDANARAMGLARRHFFAVGIDWTTAQWGEVQATDTRSAERTEPVGGWMPWPT